MIFETLIMSALKVVRDIISYFALIAFVILLFVSPPAPSVLSCLGQLLRLAVYESPPVLLFKTISYFMFLPTYLRSLK